MANHRDLDVLDAAVLVADEVNRLLDNGPRRLIHSGQLRKAAQSVPANIQEAFGRGADGGRNQSLRVARGEAEEVIEHLRANYESRRVLAATFFRLKNRLIAIVKMLTALERT